MDPSRKTGEAPRSTMLPSSNPSVRKTPSSVKHDISFLLNGTKNSASTVSQSELQIPSLSAQQKSEAEAAKSLWKQQQLWATNEVEKASSSESSTKRSSRLTSRSAAALQMKRTCVQCGRSFTQSADLKKHIKCVHLKERPFKCEQCPSAFGEKGNLNRHVKAVHGKERPWMCNICGLQFSFRDSLSRHVRAVHEGSRPFICNICGSAFKKKDHLTRHRYALHGCGK